MKRNKYYEQMKSYQPTYWLKFLEMQEILKSGATQLELTKEYINTFIDDGFILTASENKIDTIERFFGFSGNGKSLEERKKYILFRFKGFYKFNESLIKDTCKFLMNKDINVNLTSSMLEMSFDEGELLSFEYIDDFLKFIDERKPVHISYLLTSHLDVGNYSYFAFVNSRYERSKVDFHRDTFRLVEANITYGNILAGYEHSLIETIFKTKPIPNSKLNIGSTLGGYEFSRVKMKREEGEQTWHNLVR